MAGRSLRFARSPVAPKMTSVVGWTGSRSSPSISGFSWTWTAMSVLDRLALLVEPGDEPVHGLLERVDALYQQGLGDVAHVEPGVGELLEVLGGIDVARHALHLEMVGARLERVHRHRVHRVRADELLDVLHVGVLRVLGARRRPQGPLGEGASSGELVPAVAGVDLLEALVRGTGVRHRGDALELRMAEL